MDKYVGIIRRIIGVLGVISLIGVVIALAMQADNQIAQILIYALALCVALLIGSYIVEFLIYAIPETFSVIGRIFRGIPKFFKRIGKLIVSFFTNGFNKMVCRECIKEFSLSDVKILSYDDWTFDKSSDDRDYYTYVTYEVVCPHCQHRWKKRIIVEVGRGSTPSDSAIQAAVLRDVGFY